VAKTATARNRRSKAEVQQEFESIRKEAATERETSDTRAREVARVREGEVHEAVDGASVDGIVGELSALGLHVSKVLSDLSAQLIAEVERLTTLREAVEIERRELQRLHKIDIAATALDQLVQDYEARKQAFQAEIASAKSEWEAESAERERGAREYEESLKKQRQRENEEFEYKKALERKKAQDKYDEEQRVRDRQNREKQETLEKSWQDREAALKAREDEAAQLRKDAEAFPRHLEQEVQRAVAEARRQAEQASEQRLLVATKDAEADRRVADLRTKTLEEMVARQSEQLAALQRQLDEAKQQVQDIAVKAIEGASGARTLAHVNQIAMEQARTRPGQP
jgi:hypothetical protein